MAEQYFKVSELPVGSKIIFGKNKFTGKYMDGQEDIVWVVIKKDHYTVDSGYPENAVTLITEKVIRHMAWDAKEPDNANPTRRAYGNNRWSVSNIRQWLNSIGLTGQWYTPKNVGINNFDNKDTPPSALNIENTSRNYPYDVDEGFRRYFTAEERQALLQTTIKTVIPIDSEAGSTLGGGYVTETTTDYFYLPSLFEITGKNYTYNTTYPPEGAWLLGASSPYRNAQASNLTLINGTFYNSSTSSLLPYAYRTPSRSGILYYVDDGVDGSRADGQPFSNHGIRPMTNMKSTSVVVQEGEGVYRFVDNAKPYVIINSITNFNLDFQVYDYDDTLSNVTIEINGQLVKTYNMPVNTKEYETVYAIPYNQLSFGNNTMIIRATDSRGMQTIKTLNVALQHKEIITSGDKIVTKDGEYTVDNAVINTGGVTEITLNKNLVSRQAMTDVVEAYHILFTPQVFISFDFRDLPIYQNMRLKSIDYDRTNGTATEEWEYLGMGSYIQTRIRFNRPVGNDTETYISKISQIFTYMED